MNWLIDWYRRLDALQEKFPVRVACSILAVIVALGVVGLLVMRQPEWAQTFLGGNNLRAWSWGVIAALWLVVIIWMGLLLPLVLTGLLSVAAGALFVVTISVPAGLTVVGIGVLTFTFMLLTRVLLLVLRYPWQPLAIAHTVVKEAMRLRVSAFFIVVLLVALPMIPVLVSDETALRYRIQSFISWSIGLTFTLAACMTIFLACASVSFEIRDRQIWQLLTKPVSRLNYLFGKWIGIMGINMVLLMVCGVSIFGVIDYMEDMPAADRMDQAYVKDSILTARVHSQPTLDILSLDELRGRAERIIENDHTLRDAINTGQRSEFNEKRAIMRRIHDEHLQSQRRIPPGEERVYTFDGLRRAAAGDMIEFRYQLHSGASDTHSTHPVTFLFSDRRELPPLFREYVPTMRNNELLPASIVNDDGKLRLVIFNGTVRQGGVIEAGRDIINFDPDGLEIYYKIGSFEANFVRAMLVVWVKLAFLAALGIAVATVLSFPVACLFSFTIFLAGAISPFLALSLDEFYVRTSWRIDLHATKFLARGLVLVFGSFGEFTPTQSLVQGRLISWGAVAKSFALLGLVWTGVSLALGYWFFRDKELATYSGQG